MSGSALDGSRSLQSPGKRVAGLGGTNPLYLADLGMGWLTDEEESPILDDESAVQIVSDEG